MKALIEISNSHAQCGVISILIAEVSPEEKLSISQKYLNAAYLFDVYYLSQAPIPSLLWAQSHINVVLLPIPP